jgi:hypothetical protein
LNQLFVSQVYLDLLDRPADGGGLGFWTGLLNQGMDRNQLVLDVEASGEYLTNQVQALYTQFLHRAADPGGLNGFVSFLSNGGSVEAAEAIILGSSEYFQNRGGGTNDGFLSALYQDALGRPADPTGRGVFNQFLAGGGGGTSQVAAVVLGSTEYRQNLVEGYYSRYLHRPADAGGLNGFVAALNQGARDQDVIAAILSSLEYANTL